MTDAENWAEAFAGSGMQAYEDLMVRRMFEPWAQRLVEQVEVAVGEVVVDIACGPGTVARFAAVQVGEGGAVIGCDLNEAMLSIAQVKPPVAGGPIEYRRCPADSLAIDDDAGDVVVCQQGLQFFPDRAAALREMRRVARSGARLGVSVWAAIDRCPPAAALGAAIEEVLGTEAAAAFRSGPWGFTDPDALAREITAAGFTDVDVRTDTLPIVYEGGAKQLLATLAAAPVGQEVAGLEPKRRTALVDALTRATAPFTEDGEIRSMMAANTGLARA